MSKLRERYDYLYKVIIIGDSGVGKTNLILRFSDQNFKQSYVATIGVDFKMKNLQIGDKRVRLQLWDTAGQQRFRTITETYYKGASGIVLTYSINDRQSFQNINKWMKQIREKTPDHVQKIILANKCDLGSQQREISVQEGHKLAEELSTDTDKIDFIEVSAKTGQNVTEAFSLMCKKIKDYNDKYRNEQEFGQKKSEIIRVSVDKNKDKCLC